MISGIVHYLIHSLQSLQYHLLTVKGGVNNETLQDTLEVNNLAMREDVPDVSSVRSSPNEDISITILSRKSERNSLSGISQTVQSDQDMNTRRRQ